MNVEKFCPPPEIVFPSLPSVKSSGNPKVFSQIISFNIFFSYRISSARRFGPSCGIPCRRSRCRWKRKGKNTIHFISVKFFATFVKSTLEGQYLILCLAFKILLGERRGLLLVCVCLHTNGPLKREKEGPSSSSSMIYLASD